MTTQEKLVAIYEQAEKKLRDIIRKKGVYSDAAMYQRSLLWQIEAELKKLRGTSSAVVNELVSENYQTGLEELTKEVQNVPATALSDVSVGAGGESPSVVKGTTAKTAELIMSGLNKKQIEVIARNTTSDFNRAINLIGRRVKDFIREETLEATAEKLSTGQTVRQMQKNLEEKLKTKNITAVPYKNGAEMPLKKYAEMAARSTTAEAQNTAKTAQGAEWGYEFVRMTSHSPTCPVCAQYQGRVYATTKEAAEGKYKLKDGTVLKFPYLYETAFASGYQTIHPNCRHRIAVIPLEAYTNEELKKFSEDSTKPFEDTRSDRERKAYSADQARKRKQNEQRKQYEKIKQALPDTAPKSYAGFVRMKAANSQRYQDLMEDYRYIKKISNAQTTMSEQVKQLPKEQQDILKEYSGALATRLNSAIGNGKLTPELQEKSELLHKALSQGEMPETVTLYRDTCISFMKLGMSKSSTETELSGLIGSTHTNNIFTSTSFSALGLQGRDTRMHITVPKGYKGCQYIKSCVHEQYKNQEEVLFDSPLTYQFNDVKIDENGKIHLYVEVLKNDGT